MEFELNYRHTPYLFYIPSKYHHCTLNNFEFPQDKAKAKALVKTLRGFIEGDINGIFFYGGFGVGKTHLMVSLYRIMVAKAEDVSDIFFTSFEKVIRELQNRMDAKESTNDYIDYLTDVDLLFLDDITAANLQNNWVVEIFRKIVNGRYENDLRTCLTSNAGPNGLTGLNINPHAVSRIEEMCQIVKIVGKDRRVKRTKEE